MCGFAARDCLPLFLLPFLRLFVSSREGRFGVGPELSVINYDVGLFLCLSLYLSRGG